MQTFYLLFRIINVVHMHMTAEDVFQDIQKAYVCIVKL